MQKKLHVTTEEKLTCNVDLHNEYSCVKTNNKRNKSKRTHTRTSQLNMSNQLINKKKYKINKNNDTVMIPSDEEHVSTNTTFVNNYQPISSISVLCNYIDYINQHE